MYCTESVDLALMDGIFLENQAFNGGAPSS